jgi:hypothetical protein
MDITSHGSSGTYLNVCLIQNRTDPARHFLVKGCSGDAEGSGWELAWETVRERHPEIGSYAEMSLDSEWLMIDLAEHAVITG